MANTKHDLQTVLDAIRGEGRWAAPNKVTTSAGVIQTIATRLGVHRNTVNNYKEKWVTVRDAIEDEKETPIDLAEVKLFDEINKGNITAIIFMLKTKGKNRGYVERQEITGADGEPVPIAITKMDIDEL